MPSSPACRIRRSTRFLPPLDALAEHELGVHTRAAIGARDWVWISRPARTRTRRTSCAARGARDAPASRNSRSTRLRAPPSPPRRRRLSAIAVVALVGEQGGGFSQDLLFHPSTRFSRRSWTSSALGWSGLRACPCRGRPGKPVAQTALRDPDVRGDLRERLCSCTSELDGATTELRRMCTGHSEPFSRRASPLP
jgi:hypothetical protein